MKESKQSPLFTAWVFGLHISEDDANPSGPGVSASGWTIRDNQKSHEVEHLIKASRYATRIQWEARIRAIKGPLESAMVPAGSTIEMFIEQTAADTFSRVLAGQTRSSSTKKPFMGLELWVEVLAVVKEKGLTVSPLPCGKSNYGNEMLRLKGDCTAAIEERRKAIEDEGEP